MVEQRKGSEEDRAEETVKEILKAYDTLRLQMEEMNGYLADLKSLYEGLGRELEEVKQSLQENEKNNTDLLRRVQMMKLRVDFANRQGDYSREEDEEEDEDEGVEGLYDEDEDEEDDFFGYEDDDFEDDDFEDEDDDDEDEEFDEEFIDTHVSFGDPNWEEKEDPAKGYLCQRLAYEGTKRGLDLRNDASIDGSLWFWGPAKKLEALEDWCWEKFQLRGWKGTDKSLGYVIAWRPRLDLAGMLTPKQLDRPLTLDHERFMIKEVKARWAQQEHKDDIAPMVASVRFTNGHVTRWLTNFEEDGYYNFLLTEDDIFLRCTRNDVWDDGYMNYFNYNLLNTFEGIELGKREILERSVAEHEGSGSAILIKYMVALTSCEERDRDALAKLPRRSFLDVFYKELPGEKKKKHRHQGDGEGSLIIESVEDYVKHFL